MSLYTKENLNEIKSKIDYFEWYKQYLPDLSIKGKSAWACCPFHQESKPSFQINIETGMWKCWGENVGSDCFGFYQKYFNTTFQEAVEKLAEHFGVTLEVDPEIQAQIERRKNLYKVNDFICGKYEEQLQLDLNSWNYLTVMRGFTPKIIKQFRLGCGLNKMPEIQSLKDLGLLTQSENGEWYSKFRKDRITIPLFDENGNITSFQGRLCVEKEGAKYMYTSDTEIHKKSNFVYGLNFAKQYIKKIGSVICVEGMFDTIKLTQKCVLNSVALGGLNISDTQINLLKKYTNTFYIVVEDNAMLREDSKNKSILTKFYEKIKQNIPYAKVYVIDLRNEDGTKCDPDEYFNNHTREDFLEKVKTAKIYNEFIIDSILKTMKPKNIEETTACINMLIPKLADISSFLDRRQYIELVSNKLNIPENLIYKKVKFYNEKQEKLNTKNITWDSKPIYAQKILLTICFAPYFNTLKATSQVLLNKGYMQEFYRNLLEKYIAPYIVNNKNKENVDFSKFFSDILHDENISELERNTLTDVYMKVEQLEDLDDNDIDELIEEQKETLEEYVYTEVKADKITDDNLLPELQQQLEVLNI